MAATSDKQLLNYEELCNKLGIYISSSHEILNAGQIISTWGNSNVYILNNRSGSIIPNNGEVWPIRIYSYNNNSIADAINGNSKTINIRDATWDSSTIFDIYTNISYFYENNSKASAGYYVTGGPTTYEYYHVNSSGLIDDIGYYYVHNFSWTVTGSDGWVTIVSSNNALSGSAAFTTNESSLSVSSSNKKKGNTSGTTTSDSSLSTTVSSNTVSISKNSIDSSYPFSLAMMTGSLNNTTYYHGILGVPSDNYWTISATNKDGISYNGDTNVSLNNITTITNNMGNTNYTISKVSNADWITINSGNTFTFLGNTTYDTRTATLSVSTNVNASFSPFSQLEPISYTGPSKSANFTITQNGTPKPKLTLVWFPTHRNEVEKLYLIRYNQESDLTSFTYNDLSDSTKIEAPARIVTSNMILKVGLQQNVMPDINNYVQYSCIASFNTNNDECLIAWIQEVSGNSKIYHEDGEIKYGVKNLPNPLASYTLNTPISVSWRGTAPSGWDLRNTLLIK